MAGVALPSFIQNFFKKKKPLSVDQLKGLAEIEVRWLKEIKLVPGKERINHFPVYMLVEFHNIVVAKVFTDKVTEFAVPKNNWKREGIVLLERILKEIKRVCK